MLQVSPCGDVSDPGNLLAPSPPLAFLLEAESGKRSIVATRRRKRRMKRKGKSEEP